MVTKIGRKCEVFDKLCDILNRSAKLTCDTFANGIVMCYTAKNGRHRKEPVYVKERVFGGNGAVGCQLGAGSAPDEKGGRTAEKAAGKGQGNEQINIPRRSRVYIPKSSKL